MPHHIKRLKRQGQRGKIPKGAKFVGRPSKWGNDHKVDIEAGQTQEIAVLRHKEELLVKLRTDPQLLEELRGLDLVCYCESDEACHADTLIELANRPKRVA